MLYYVFAIGVMVWSLIVQARLRRLVSKFCDVRVVSGKDANTCVREMLQANGIDGIAIEHTDGFMTDHYNPKQDSINLSDTSYGQRSITAVAIAAHECGHACQAHSGMLMYRFRQLIAPAAGITSKLSIWVVVCSG